MTKRTVPKVVTYINLGLNSVEDYWRELVVPNVQEYMRDRKLRTAFNAALALWHLVDWAWHEQHPGQDTRANHEFKAYQQRLIAACPELAWLHDIAEATKHRGLGRDGIKVEEAMKTQLGKRPPFVVMVVSNPRPSPIVNDPTPKPRAEMIDVYNTFVRVIEFWRAVEFKGKNLPSPF